jgi:hypothetical protein
VPREDRIPEWKADYNQMEEMFFEEPPGFEKVLEVVRGFEERLNRLGR